MPLMTNKEYIDNSANKCPQCGGDDITGDSIEFGSSTASRKVDCHTCDFTWIENFEGNDKDTCDCGCENVDYSESGQDGTSAWQEVECLECHETWDNDYEIVSWEAI